MAPVVEVLKLALWFLLGLLLIECLTTISSCMLRGERLSTESESVQRYALTARHRLESMRTEYRSLINAPERLYYNVSRLHDFGGS